MKQINAIQFYQTKRASIQAPWFVFLSYYAAILAKRSRVVRRAVCRVVELNVDQLPLPSLSLLRKLASEEVDSYKVVKVFLEKGSISEDYVLLINEMYFPKSTQYHSGDSLGVKTEELCTSFCGFLDFFT